MSVHTSIPRTWTYSFCTTARLAKDSLLTAATLVDHSQLQVKEKLTDIAKSLKELGVQFNLIITSPLKRSHQTASLALMTFNSENNMENWDELKPEGNGKEIS